MSLFVWIKCSPLDHLFIHKCIHYNWIKLLLQHSVCVDEWVSPAKIIFSRDASSEWCSSEKKQKKTKQRLVGAISTTWLSIAHVFSWYLAKASTCDLLLLWNVKINRNILSHSVHCRSPVWRLQWRLLWWPERWPRSDQVMSWMWLQRKHRSKCHWKL